MESDIIIIGAGASGLMAARELSRSGKKVLILEARERIGGRIWPLPHDEFGFPAQAGAEFVHGAAPVTRALMNEAGLTYIPMNGEMWSSRGGEPTKNQEFIPDQEVLDQKLAALSQDMPVAEFLDMHFADEKYGRMRNAVTKMVEGYDAADPKRISTFSLREEWLSSTGSSGADEWQQGRIKEGYGALLTFLENECHSNGVIIQCNTRVQIVSRTSDGMEITTETGAAYYSKNVIVTVPLPLLKEIIFVPDIQEKIAAADQIGFGNVIKILLRFKSRWWDHAAGKDFTAMDFMLSNERVTTWWTQGSDQVPVLTGWIAGPTAQAMSEKSSEELLGEALMALSNIFKIDKKHLEEQLEHYRVVNWPKDPFTKGAYSYSTPEARTAYKVLAAPIEDRLYFAGEALYKGKETATVEGALASGKEVAREIVKH